ncbi:hypothetical protein ACFV0Z_27730 [Streptomyces xiamenensis]|uniref:hypothetical protein n=1 Tax=Streptomyces xiamenensis TaxID=408015 RepID=UPI003687BE6C
MALILALEHVLTTAAENWPGGPRGFAVTLGLLGAAGVLVTVFYGVAGKWPHRVGPRLRVGVRAKRWIMAVAGVLSGLAFLILLSSITFRSTNGSPRVAILGLFVENSPGAAVTGLAVALVALLAGGFVLAGNLGGDTPRERADLVARMCGALLFVAWLITMLTSSRLLEEDYVALAHKWPGGPLGFLLCAGAGVPLGIAGAVWAIQRRRRLTLPGTALLVAPSIALITASLSVLIGAVPPRDYKGPYLCDKGFYCALDQTHDQAGLIVGLGWLAIGVTGVLLGYATVKVKKRSRR